MSKKEIVIADVVNKYDNPIAELVQVTVSGAWKSSHQCKKYYGDHGFQPAQRCGS